MMNRTSSVLALLVVIVIAACEKKTATLEAPESVSLNFQVISDKLLRQANLQPGERVLLIGVPGRFDSLVSLLGNKIFKEGGVFLGAISIDTLGGPDSWNTDFVRSTEGKSMEELTAQFANVDLGIMLPGATPAHKPYAALQKVLNSGKGRTIHFHWIGAYDISGQPIPIDAAIDTLYEATLLETDYAALSFRQKDFERTVREKGLRVTTPAGTVLTMQIGDRPVTKQDGDASLAHTANARNLIDREVELPAGAIRVAPMEETVQGTIAFPDGVWSGEKVEGLVLTFKKGKVTAMTARSGQEAVKAELDKGGDAAYSFREIAVGFNPMLAIPEENPWIPYYGYGAGVIRLSLGDNTELGGKVSGPYVRWNFFIDATVTVGDEIWIKDGKLVKYP